MRVCYVLYCAYLCACVLGEPLKRSQALTSIKHWAGHEHALTHTEFAYTHMTHAHKYAPHFSDEPGMAVPFSGPTSHCHLPLYTAATSTTATSTTQT